MREHQAAPWVTAYSSGRLPGPPAGRAVPRPRRGTARGHASRVYRARSTSRPISAFVDTGGLRVFATGAADTSGRLPLLVLSEELFRSALSRERRRADRCEQGFVLLTMMVGPEALEALVAGLAAATGETDLIGWMEQDEVLGVILPDVATPADATARQIEARVRRELTRRLGPGAADQLVIYSYVHEGPRLDADAGLAVTDPLLADLRAVEADQRGYFAIKRLLDVIGGAFLLLLSLPLFLMVALLVKLTSPGPVLFRQSRVGHRARRFTMLKFRTMHVDNNSEVHRQFVKSYIQSGDHPAVATGAAPFKIARDPRTTPVGRFLRRASLDELPQFWNVLMGDMSLVGPRPPIAYELENYRPWHWHRVLEAKPGLTGLWQVVGRSRTTFDEMVRLDLRYARTRSLWLDLKILLATPGAVITGKGAR
jgi:lipopolysaccharide/colanic/teichoic acid biosynthesis glycosyltransferase